MQYVLVFPAWLEMEAEWVAAASYLSYTEAVREEEYWQNGNSRK
jgi:hypothetical protein